MLVVGEFALVKSAPFGSMECDFYGDRNELYMSRKQIGEALEYSDPQKAIDNIHQRNAERLDKFSTTLSLGGVEGGRFVQRETVVYSAKGIYEICRWSRQPKANDFFDWVYEMIEQIRRGDVVVMPVADYRQMEFDLKRQDTEIRRMNAEARERNARTRQAQLLIDVGRDKGLSSKAVELLGVGAMELLTGEVVEYRPEIDGKHYTATEIATRLGTTANAIGRLANTHSLKTEEFGIMVLDKSRHSDKQVPTFRYSERGFAKIRELLRGQMR